MRTKSYQVSALFLSLSFLALACSQSEDGGKHVDPSSAGTMPTSSSGSGGAGNKPGGTGGLTLGGSTTDGGSSSAGSGGVITTEEACATGTVAANLAGVNLLVMFDRSNSMLDPANDLSESRWTIASRALTGFFADPEAAGLDVALRFFPHDEPAEGCNQTGCDVAACSKPLVELGTLTAEAAPTDAQEKALIDATNMTVPPPMLGEGTPISAALDGALRWATEQRMKTPTENAAVALVTDGQATGCDTDTTTIAALASDAFAAHGIRTYAIGLTGAIAADLDAIASAGGTEKAIFVADGAEAQQQLLEALAAIRGSVLDCDLPMPEPEAGEKVDPSKVNVNLTNGAGMKSTLPQLLDEASCGSQTGWYYDHPDMPTRIVLCPATCSAVSTDPLAMLQILLGCSTITDVPR
jgi:hypothetical protein